MELSIPILVISILLGFLLGIISGLIPGIHVNNFSLILVAMSPLFMEMGFAPFYIAVIILSNSVTQTLICHPELVSGSMFLLKVCSF